MAISYIDHIVLHVKNLKRSKDFYSAILGDPAEEDSEATVFLVGQTRLFLTTPRNKAWSVKFNKENIGLNHLAFGVESFQELNDIALYLKKAKVENSGIQIDEYGKKPFIWLDDPDGIRLEFYQRLEV